MQPVVSILMPVYNSSKYLDRSITSVLSQTYEKYELIAIDDGSCDNSKDIILSYMSNDKRIKYIYQDNKGIAGARNAGILNAEGTFIALLDADDMWLPNKLEVCVNTLLSEDDSVGLVHSAYQVVDDKDNIIKQNENSSVNNMAGWLLNDLGAVLNHASHIRVETRVSIEK
jgi:glycosyltransferase involved in cell wall biosynthesis